MRVSRQAIIASKYFYRDYYRVAARITAGLMFISVFLIILTVYYIIREPAPDFYATNGITSPEKLTPLDGPNESSEPLMEPDMPDEMSDKGDVTIK